MKKVRLYCLPYAGGSAAIYSKYKKYLDSFIDLCPLELPGRGRKYPVPFYNSLEEASSDILEEIKHDINTNEVAFWGHSMGAFIVYEIVQKMIRNQYKMPVCVFFSGQCAPHKRKKQEIHKMDLNSFKNEILKMGGTSQEVLENPELFEIYSQILRADFKLVETHQFSSFLKWNVNITSFHGKEDNVILKEDVLEWKDYTSKDFRFVEFEGNHFFVNEKVEEIAKAINQSLSR